MALALLPNVNTGSVISPIMEQRPVQVRVAGIVWEMPTPGAAYASPETFARTIGQAGLTNAVRVALKDPARWMPSPVPSNGRWRGNAWA